jgi:hypothetical protein
MVHLDSLTLLFRRSDHLNAAVQGYVHRVCGLIVQQEEHSIDDVRHSRQPPRWRARRHGVDKGLSPFLTIASHFGESPTKPDDTELMRMGANSNTMVFIIPTIPALATLIIVEVG